MPWIAAMLRGSRVFARVDDTGKWMEREGRVEVRYRADDGRAYFAFARNLERAAGATILPDSHCAEGSPVKNSKAEKKEKAAAAIPNHPDGTVIVYADGACSGNPGPCGLGVVLVDGTTRRELSEYLGDGTNNIAELTAILRAASYIEDKTRRVRIHTDSSYSIGVLQKNWKAKANPLLIGEVKTALGRLNDVELIYVPGHAGVVLNERADELARQAVQSRSSTGWVSVS